MFRRLSIAVFAVTLPVIAFAGKPSSGSTQTGQGIGIVLQAEGSFAVSANRTYRFNEETAAGYFSNALVSGPVVTCSGNATNCGAANAPALSAPAPRATEIANAVNGPSNGGPRSNKCAFLDGVELAGHSYVQSAGAKGLNGQGNWTYTWSYAVTPTSVPAPFDAWDLISETGSGQAQVTIEADIMGESAMKNAKMSGPKYSFSMGDALNPRVVNLVLTVDGTPYPATSNIVTGEDFHYVTNAGANGVTSLLRNGSALYILNTDSHPGNNNGGAGGSALARAVMVPMELSFSEGTHTVTLTGVVKGNSIDGEAPGANLGFSVTQTLHVITPGCGNSGN